MEGYCCDICGHFFGGEPGFTVRPKGEDFVMKIGGSEHHPFPRYDICRNCWSEKIGPLLAKYRFPMSPEDR